MGNTDPNNTKGKEIRGQASVRRAIKQLIMQHAKIDAMKCMRANKGRIARPVNQLANHLSRASIPRTVYQPGKSSVRDLQSPSSHHSSVVFRHNQSVDHHSDDSVGLFTHDTYVGSHNVALNQVINQSVNQAQDVCISISADFTTSITAMFTLKAAKSAQFVPQTADFYLNRYNKARQFQLAPTSFHLAPSTTAEAILNLKSVKETHTQFISSSNLKLQYIISYGQELESGSTSKQTGHAKQLNDVVRDTSPLLPTAEQKRYTQNATFQLNKTMSPLQQQLVTGIRHHCCQQLNKSVTLKTLRFNLTKRCRLSNSSWLLKPSAGHQLNQIPRNATADSTDSSSSATADLVKRQRIITRYSTVDLR
ncbi:hypothetical protein F511_34460 [Dorcoceras hygrometricum]|uniref:Uncharacterized protein n=1 Tax=Dorcoceras hygrometricum TaxID=472368 RepID=A0A2Z7BLN9_9LAMI|nr:hypothetical protein F511_34460 [Dorcoceras hygrometricum]